MIDDDLGAPSAEEMIELLKEEVEILTAQLDALSSTHRTDLLAAEIRARFGIKRRLDQELGRVVELTRDLKNRDRQLQGQRAVLSELKALVQVVNEHELLARVRGMVRGA